LLLGPGVEELSGNVGDEQHGAEDQNGGDADDTPAASAVAEGRRQERRVQLLNERFVMLRPFIGIEA